MQSLRVHNEKLNESLQQVQVQFARLKVQHLELKKEVTKSAATPTTPTEPSTPIQVYVFAKQYIIIDIGSYSHLYYCKSGV